MLPHPCDTPIPRNDDVSSLRDECFGTSGQEEKLPQLKTGVQHSNKAEQMQKLQGKREVFVLNPTIGMPSGNTCEHLREFMTCSQSPKIEALMKQTSTRGVDGAVMKKPPTGYKCVVTEKAGSNATKGTAKGYKEPLAANQGTVKGRSGNSSARTETQMTQQGFLIHMVKLTSKEVYKQSVKLLLPQHPKILGSIVFLIFATQQSKKRKTKRKAVQCCIDLHFFNYYGDWLLKATY
ncbi:PREDICTED: uncharacterized protein LOC109378091 [Hipposideros armiger]|uniref:Uncharacterized protein LOC109378091 n=1 Tax=Hipposideros armiger TaxID=186990 RepID=A0A8B7QNK5_HIPAR|nr:PREDICTED: uncharacterized protein LOC109378091 [Hipposideros armiger]